MRHRIAWIITAFSLLVSGPAHKSEKGRRDAHVRILPWGGTKGSGIAMAMHF